MSKKEKAFNKGFFRRDKESILRDRNRYTPVKTPSSKNQKEYLKLYNQKYNTNLKQLSFPTRITKDILEKMYYSNLTEDVYYQNIYDNFLEDFTKGWNSYVVDAINKLFTELVNTYGKTTIGKALDNFDYDLSYFFQAAWEDSDQPYSLIESFVIGNIPFITDKQRLELENVIDGSDFFEDDNLPF